MGCSGSHSIDGFVTMVTTNQERKDRDDPNIGKIWCNGQNRKCENVIRIDYRDRYLEDGKDNRVKEWRADKSVHLCQDCRSKFNAINRKHHCRFCGDIFCDSCSSLRVTMKDIYECAKRPYRFISLEDKPERICNECFRKMLKVDCNVCNYSFCLVWFLFVLLVYLVT